jgi:hypothetical protein
MKTITVEKVHVDKFNAMIEALKKEGITVQQEGYTTGTISGRGIKARYHCDFVPPAKESDITIVITKKPWYIIYGKIESKIRENLK